MIYFNTDGIPTKDPVNDRFWICQGPMSYMLKENDYSIEIETQAHHLRNLLAKKIFGSLQHYYDLLPSTQIWFSHAGIDSDIKISREQFERLIAKADKRTYHFLYYYDVSALIGSL